MDLSRGSRLGLYEILAPIGAGGMGEVYSARDTKLGREVAIKVLPEELAQDKERLERFEREARLLAQLNHPNVATLHGLEESKGRQFIVMELVDGETLAERISAGAIPIPEATNLFTQIAAGLEAAHGEGIIHRDLKPANIKITPSGNVKILDFGLAKSFVEQAPTSALSQSPTVTRGTATGVILGTAPYMSPEQARGTPVDKRTDVWAFGCCLFEALTKEVAFLGDTVTDTIVRIVEREPQWSALPGKTPPSIHRLLRRCLQKDPDRRLRDVGDARIELDDVGTMPVSEEPSARARRGLWVAALVVVAMLSAVLWNLGSRPARRSDSIARVIVSLSPGDALNQRQSEYAKQGIGSPPVAVSRDGTELAYIGVQDDVDGSQLYIRNLAEEEARPVRDSANPYGPFFSPEGDWVGFFSGGFLKKVAVSGGSPITVCEAPAARGGTWSEDGLIVFAPLSRTNLALVSADGGTPEPVTVLDIEFGETSHRFPSFLPGGKAFLFMAEGSTRSESRIVVQSLSTGERRVLVEGAAIPRYSASGHLLYLQGGTTLAAPFDLDRAELTGPGVPVLAEEATLLGVSETGTLVYLAEEVLPATRQLVWVARDGQEEPLAATPRGYLQPRLSPEELRIAVDIEQEGDRNIWMYDIGRDTLTRVTFDRANLWPLWTPDGSHITYGSNQPNTVWDIHWTRADGAGVDEALWVDELAQYPRTWSPDGRTLAFQNSDPNQADIWLLSLDDGKTRPWSQTAGSETEPAFSPNGQWIAYASNESGRQEVYVRPLSGDGKWQISTGGGRAPMWSRDGTELFHRNGSKMYVARVSAADTFQHETPTELFEGTYFSSSTGHAAYDVAGDGRFLMVKLEPVTAPRQLNIVLNWFQELERLVPTSN